MANGDLGPLPQGDRNDELQQLSLTAHRNLFPPDRFLVRDERMDDKGVDGALELKVAKGFTNIRAQYQLKSEEVSELNEDTSISYAVKVSNLNYLMNGPCPLYLLWSAGRQEMRYAWVRDEYRRLEDENPTWRNQTEVTIRFRHVLDATRVDELHARILAEGKLHRAATERLAAAVSSETVAIHIDPDTLKAVDPEEVFKIVVGSGLALVARGDAGQVCELAEQIPPRRRMEPKIQLALAYASVSLGHYLTASGYLAQAGRRLADLTEAECHVLRTLKLSCDYQTRRIDLRTYHAREQELERDAPQGFKDQHAVERLKAQYISNPGEASKSALAELRALEARIAGSDATAVFKLSARLTRLHLEGCDHCYTLQRFCTLARHRLEHGTGGPSSMLAEVRRLVRGFEEWSTEAMAALGEAEAMGHPLLVVDAILSYVQVHVYSLNDQRYLIYLSSGSAAPFPASAIQPLERQVGLALGILGESEYVERRLGARMLLADLADLGDRCDLAKTIATQVINDARAMELQSIVYRAEEHLRSDAHFRQFKRLHDERMAQDDDISWLAKGDEEIPRFARKMLEVLGLTEVYLPVLERDAVVCRDAARQRRDWCRHLGLRVIGENLPLPTLYARDPNRRAVCELLHHQTMIETPDWDSLVRSFKAMFCTGCSHRSPKAASDA